MLLLILFCFVFFPVRTFFFVLVLIFDHGCGLWSSTVGPQINFVWIFNSYNRLPFNPCEYATAALLLFDR